MPSNFSTQINLPDVLQVFFRSAQGAFVDQDDLGVNGFDKGGPPHVTVRYAIETDDISRIFKVVKDFFPFYVGIGNLTTFPASEFSDGDVPLIFEIHSPQLYKLNKAIEKNLPCKPANFPYTPHMTFAYIKPESEGKYKGRHVPNLTGKEFVSKNLVFMTKEGNEIPVV